MPKYTKAAQARTGNRKQAVLNQGRGSTKKVPPAVPVAKGLPRMPTKKVPPAVPVAKGLPKTLARKKR